MSNDEHSQPGPNAASPVTRRILERCPLPGAAGRELVVAEVTYPPGGAAPVHTHPVAGVVYIVEGVAESAYGADEPVRYAAGTTFQDQPNVPHTFFRNCDESRPLRILITYVLQPGQDYFIES
jgi:quercetin dioxygenase-like cupin family protein